MGKHHITNRIRIHITQMQSYILRLRIRKRMGLSRRARKHKKVKYKDIVQCTPYLK